MEGKWTRVSTIRVPGLRGRLQSHLLLLLLLLLLYSCCRRRRRRCYYGGRRLRTAATTATTLLQRLRLRLRACASQSSE